MSSNEAIVGSSLRREWVDYSVKGSLLSARPRYLKETWGDDALKGVLAVLDGPTRATLESAILPFAWYPFETLLKIDEAIIEGPMKGDITQIKPFGRAVAQYDLPTIYKVLFKIGTPAFLIKRVGTVYGTYVKGGSMTAAVVGKTASVTLTGALPAYFCQQGIPGWFTAALELSGAKAVRVTEGACIHRRAANCRWDATWE
jgi:hypothetical protein